MSLGAENDAVLLSFEELHTLDDALARLQEEEQDLVEALLMRYFCGLTIAETATLLEIRTRTVERR